MNFKPFGGFFEQFHHCYNTSTSSDEWVPDSAASALASEPANSTLCSPVSSYTSEKALDESGILLNLEAVSTPPSPNKSQHDYEHINEITTAMMELQVNEDRILKNLQTVLRLSPQSAPQLDKYISPSLRNRLNSSSQLSIAPTQEFQHDNNSFNNDPGSENRSGLVPFIRNLKEARKPSYGIR